MKLRWIYPFIILGGALQTGGAANLASMPWWAPLGGLVGAVQVYAGLTLVHKIRQNGLYASATSQAGGR